MSTSVAERPPIELHQARDMLAYIDGVELREIWLAIGMALKAEFGDVAFDVWDSWSQSAGNYDFKACQASWRGFRARAGGVTIGTLIKLALDGGYQFPNEEDDDADARHKRQVEIARRRAERDARAQAERAQKQERAWAAEAQALIDWRAATREGASDYLSRKGIVGAESVRFADGGIVVPMLRYDAPREQSLKGVQRIAADGAKRFTPGAAKVGTACRLGLPVVGEPVFLCEGYATGMSIRMAIELLAGARRWPVFVAFDAYNLPLVCELVHQMLPTCPLVICGDDDWQTKVRGVPHNTGAIQAQVAQESVLDAGAKLVVRSRPLFEQATPRGAKDTDFNDLHRLEGLPAVAAQLQTALDCIEEIKKYG
ncbi:MAG: PriCT-2 domain-containing protein [Ottowia sp.]|uniref:PriCT-2 domain-containing protein n=1 Tax=Ottowia sp. TaxID=1898956 RepID=UPI003C790007